MTGLVKHYQNDMKGIPQLTNAWGCMITLLDAVLVTGFNFRSVLGLSKASAGSLTAIITLEDGHGFIERQVVRIKDSTNGWNGDFKVLSVTSTSITIECSASYPSTISGTAQAYTAPLNWEIVFSTAVGSSEPKRAYRSKDPDSLGLMLLVHDFCVSGAASTGAKFAKVGIVSSMSDIDTITGTQLPYDASAPNANWGWDGTYHGWAKWYYRSPTYSTWNYTYSDSNTGQDGTTSYYLVGDSDSFLINLAHTFDAVYGVTEFEDPAINARNIGLLACGINGSRNSVSQGATLFRGGRGGYGVHRATNASFGVASDNSKIAFWFNSAGLANYEVGGRYYCISRLESYGATSGTNINSGDIIATDDTVQEWLVDTTYKVRGVLPFFRKSFLAQNKVSITSMGKIVFKFGTSESGFYRYALNLEAR